MLVLALLAVLVPTARAGAWTQPAGEHYVKLWTRTLVGKGIFGADGSRTPIDLVYVDSNVQAYGELGLTDHLTAVAALTPLGFAAHNADRTVYSGANVAGLRLGGTAGDVRLAVEARAGGVPPIGNDVVGGVLTSESGPYVYQPTVAGARVEAEVQAGGPLPFGWWVVAPGLRWWSADDLPLGVLVFAQLGWSISEHWTTDLHVSVLEPLSPTEAPAVANASGAGWTRYQGFGAAGSWWFEPQWGLQFGIEGVVGAAANAETPTIVLGVEHRSGR